MVDIEIKPEILNFVPVGNDNINYPEIQIKTECEDPDDPDPLNQFNESYYLIQCKCSVIVKRSDKSVQCNLYEEQIEEIEQNKLTISKIEENTDYFVDTVTYHEHDNDVTVDNFITYSSISESSEDEAEELFAKIEKTYEQVYTVVDGGYKCKKCDKISDNRQKILQHSVSHLEYSRLCYGCGKLYTDSNHLQCCPSLHKAKNEANDQNEATGYKRQTRNSFEIRECKDCGKTIRSILDGNDHQNIHKNLKPYICSCGSTCRFFDNFIIHLKKFKCPVDKCIIPDYAPQNIQRWIDREPNHQYRRTTTNVGQSGSRFNIGTKKKNITAAERSSKHKKLPDSELNCKECGIDKFSNYVKYREHIEIKHSEKKFECKDKRCGRKFATERRLRDHVKEIHLIQYKCEKCNFVFSRRTFRRHKVICSGLNNEKITVLNYKTTFRNQLFYCSICKEYEEHWKIRQHFTKTYHKKLEKTWKEKYNIKEYKCTKCKDLTKSTKNNIYHYFIHLAKTHEFCFILQLNDIIKSFENKEPFIFNVDIKNSKLPSTLSSTNKVD